MLTIWVLALLAVLTLGLTTDVRSGARLMRDQLGLAQARALADGGFWQALGELVDGDMRAADRLDGMPRTVTVGGRPVIVSLQDEAGRLDLNKASAAQLRRLFRAIRLDPELAERLARNIGHYRDAAQAASEREAESPFDQSAAPRAPRPYVPAFLSKRELRLVDGITSEAYTRILPFVTVHSGDWRIDPLTASAPVLLSLAGVDADTVERFLAVRRRQPDPIAVRIAAPPSIVRQAVWHVPRIVTIHARARLGDGTVAEREVTVTLSPGNEPPFKIIAWR